MEISSTPLYWIIKTINKMDQLTKKLEELIEIARKENHEVAIILMIIEACREDENDLIDFKNHCMRIC